MEETTMALPDVNLYVAREMPTDGQQWHVTQDGNGTPYWYRFEGGNKSNGNQSCSIANGKAHFHIHLKTPQEYALVAFGRDPATDRFNQLTADAPNAGQNIIKVHDACSHLASGIKYGVYVATRAQPDLSFWCDPVITNEP